MGIDPSTVTPETELTGADLAWTEQELPQRLRTKHVHGIVPFSGKYIPQLVEVLLRKYWPDPSLAVIDPFCGSGTTLVEANTLGIPAVGMDLMHYAGIVTSAKVCSYDLGTVEMGLGVVLEQAEYRAEHASELEHRLLFEPVSDWMRRWYTTRSLIELRAYRRSMALLEYGSPEHRLAMIVLARAARSARLVPHFALAEAREPVTDSYYCHKHRRLCQPTPDAVPFLRRYTADVLRRITAFQEVRKLRGHRDAFVMSGLDISAHWPQVAISALPVTIGGLIASPPYLGNIDYHEQHRYFYEFFPEVVSTAQQEIGSRTAGTSAASRQAYVSRMINAVWHLLPSLPDGAPVVLVANDRYSLYPTIRGALGLEEENVLHRPVGRRTGLRTSTFEESIFVWRVTERAKRLAEEQAKRDATAGDTGGQAGAVPNLPNEG